MGLAQAFRKSHTVAICTDVQANNVHFADPRFATFSQRNQIFSAIAVRSDNVSSQEGYGSNNLMRGFRSAGALVGAGVSRYLAGSAGRSRVRLEMARLTSG